MMHKFGSLNEKAILEKRSAQIIERSKIGTYLLFWAEIPPDVLSSLRFLENKQATARNIILRFQPVTIYWDTMVYEVGDRSRIRACR